MAGTAPDVHATGGKSGRAEPVALVAVAPAQTLEHDAQFALGFVQVISQHFQNDAQTVAGRTVCDRLGISTLTIGHFCPTCGPVKGKEFIKRLKRNGVEIIEGRGKGGHVWAIHNGRKTTVPFHGSADVDPNFLKLICKQLGFNPDDVL